MQARSEVLRAALEAASPRAAAWALAEPLAADVGLALGSGLDPRWDLARHRVRPLPGFCLYGSGYVGFDSWWELMLKNAARRALAAWMSRRSVAVQRLVLRVVGLGALAQAAAAAAVWAPAAAVFIALSAVFPLTQLPRCFQAGFGSGLGGGGPNASSGAGEQCPSEVLGLPCALSAGYAACLACLGLLSPLVYRFQLTRASVRDASGFPEPFYGPGIVRGVYRRYAAALARADLSRALCARVGRYNAMSVISFLDEGNEGAPYV